MRRNRKLAQIEPEETSASRAAYMTNEELLARVQGAFQKIADEMPCILELRARFARQKRGSASICGCRSWEEFCTKRLHRTPRRIRQVLAAYTDDDGPGANAADGKHVTAVTVPGVFRVLLADPPWNYGNRSCKIPYAAENHYRTMPVEDICAMKLPRIAENAVLFLWTTTAMLEKALQVIAAWRFDYKTNFVWDKVLHNVGHFSSVRHELLLVATRGSCHPDIPTLVDSVVSIPRTEHSAKPAYFRELIDKLYPFGNRIELFARGSLPENWAGWGNEFEAKRVGAR